MQHILMFVFEFKALQIDRCNLVKNWNFDWAIILCLLSDKLIAIITPIIHTLLENKVQCNQSDFQFDYYVLLCY